MPLSAKQKILNRQLDSLPPPPSAVLHHDGERRGRRSKSHPILNFRATAEIVGISRSHLAKILDGVNRCSLSVAVRLAEALGITPAAIDALYKPKPKLKSTKSKTKPRGKNLNAKS